MTIVDDLQQQVLRTFSAEVPSGSRVALLDYPFHLNPGDALIWLGEHAWAERTGVELVRVRHREVYNRAFVADQLPADAPILIHGGGNFGDLHHEHQLLRMQIVADFPDRRIIQLPQTLNISNRLLIEADARKMQAHGQVTLMWRDTRSFELGQQLFPGCESLLVPDAAFVLGDLSAIREGPGGELCLCRADKEAGELGGAVPPGMATSDWKLTALRRAAYTPMWRGSRVLERLERGGHRVPESVWRGIYSAVATNNFVSARRLLSNRSHVVTDRLHGHILCTLLRVPHDAVDDQYGKVSSFYETWTTGDSISRLVSPAEAFALRSAEGASVAG